MDDQDASAALIEKIGIIGRTACGACGYGNSSDFHRRKIRDSKLGYVRQDQHDAMFFLDSEPDETIACAIYLFRDLSVRQLARAARYCNRFATSLAHMTIDKSIDDVVTIWKVNHAMLSVT